MSGREEVEALRRLYGQSTAAGEELADRLRRRLPELGECLSGQLAELGRAPSRERCDRVLQSLTGVATHVRQLAAAMEVRE